eukprot:591130-Prorocentrum_minimum.AAC.1
MKVWLTLASMSSIRSWHWEMLSTRSFSARSKQLMAQSTIWIGVRPKFCERFKGHSRMSQQQQSNVLARAQHHLVLTAPPRFDQRLTTGPETGATERHPSAPQAGSSINKYISNADLSLRRFVSAPVLGRVEVWQQAGLESTSPTL